MSGPITPQSCVSVCYRLAQRGELDISSTWLRHLAADGEAVSSYA